MQQAKDAKPGKGKELKGVNKLESKILGLDIVSPNTGNIQINYEAVEVITSVDDKDDITCVKCLLDSENDKSPREHIT